MVAGTQKCLCRELEHVVRAVAQHDLFPAHAVTRRERVLQLETVAVRIAGDLRGRRGNRLTHLPAGTAWILIRSEFDDRICRQSVFARELVDGLARHVRCNAADVFRSQDGDSLTGELFGIHREVNRGGSGLQATAAGYEPSSLRNGARWRSSASAAATTGSSQWPSRSTKNRYSHKPVRAGRDSSRDMLTPCLAKGSSKAYIAPGRFCADITSEVSSLPDGAAAWCPSTQNRVVLLGSSSMCAAITSSP